MIDNFQTFGLDDYRNPYYIPYQDTHANTTEYATAHTIPLGWVNTGTWVWSSGNEFRFLVFDDDDGDRDVSEDEFLRVLNAGE